MGTVVPETCWAYKKYNKIISNICIWCSQAHNQRGISGYIAPTVYLAAPTRNMQNTQDKHVDQPTKKCVAP
jgi:hypothetical protein